MRPLEAIYREITNAYRAGKGLPMLTWEQPVIPSSIRKSIGPNDDDWKCHCGAWNVHWAQKCVRCGDGLDVEPPDRYEKQP